MEKTMRTEKLVIPFYRKKSRLLEFEADDTTIKVNPSPLTPSAYDLCLYKTGTKQNTRRYYSLLSDIGTEEIDVTDFDSVRLVRSGPGIKCVIELIINKAKTIR